MNCLCTIIAFFFMVHSDKPNLQSINRDQLQSMKYDLIPKPIFADTPLSPVGSN